MDDKESFSSGTGESPPAHEILIVSSLFALPVKICPANYPSPQLSGRGRKVCVCVCVCRSLLSHICTRAQSCLGLAGIILHVHVGINPCTAVCLQHDGNSSDRMCVPSYSIRFLLKEAPLIISPSIQFTTAKRLGESEKHRKACHCEGKHCIFFHPRLSIIRSRCFESL